jgi:hypothetical protein
MLFKLGFVWQSLCPLKEEQKTAIGFQRKMTGCGDGHKKQARNGLTKVNLEDVKFSKPCIPMYVENVAFCHFVKVSAWSWIAQTSQRAAACRPV